MHFAQKAALDKPWKLIAVIAAAAALRVGLPLFAVSISRTAPQFHEPDTEGYLRVGAEWLQTGRFAVNGEPEIVRTPGYPLLLLSGIAAGHVNMVTIVLQTLLACVTVWLVYRIALQLFNSPLIALGAAWLFACEPISVLYTSKLLSETFFTTLTLAGLWQLTAYLTSQSRRALMAAAVSIAAAAYVRPIAYYLPAGMALTLWVLVGKQASSRMRVTLEAAAFLVLAMALIVPWQVRNWLEGDYAGFSAISDQNLYFYEALPVELHLQGLTPAEREAARLEAGEADMRVYLRHHPEQADWTAAEHYRYLRREALKTLLAHPAAAARIHVAGILHTLTDSGRNAWLSYFGLSVADTSGEVGAGGFWQRLKAAARQRPLVLAIHLLLTAVLAVYLLLALAGILRLLRHREALLLLSAFLCLLLLSGSDAGYHRFRVPLTPLLCVFAAEGYRMLSGLRLACFCHRGCQSGESLRAVRR